MDKELQGSLRVHQYRHADEDLRYTIKDTHWMAICLNSNTVVEIVACFRPMVSVSYIDVDVIVDG